MDPIADRAYAELYYQTQKNLAELEEMNKEYMRASANVKAKAMPVSNNNKEVKVTLLPAARPAAPSSGSRRAWPTFQRGWIHPPTTEGWL